MTTPNPSPSKATIYSESSRGLTIHLRWMHYDLDPSSPHFRRHRHRPYHTVIANEEERCDFAVQRLPIGEESRHKFLWAALFCADWDARGDAKAIIMGIYESAAAEIAKAEDVMRGAGPIFQDIYADWCADMLRDEEHAGDIQTSPAYQETTSVYFQLASRIPYLRQVQSLMVACNVAGLNHTVAEPIREAVTAVWYDLNDTPDLNVASSMDLAYGYKDKGDKAAEENDGPGAVSNYVHAIKVLLPWYPSEYWIAPWEARVLGLGGLIVKLNINIAIVLRSFFGNFKSAYHILDNISSSVCATNWEKAKILHCDCLLELTVGEVPVNECEWELDPDPLPDIHYLDLLRRRDGYQQHPLGRLANPTWITDFSPMEFIGHYHELALRSLGQRNRPWYMYDRTEAALRVCQWINRMKTLHVSWAVDVKKEPVECRDLEVENAMIEEKGRSEFWDFRTE